MSLELPTGDGSQSSGGLFGPDPNGALRIERCFTREGVHQYDEVEWDHRYASITAENGEIIFEANDVEMPSFWSQTATNVVVSKYFKVGLGQASRETSLKTLISRVVDTITVWGREDGYFVTDAEAKIFSDELTHLLLYQKAAFNSPVWFNIGVEKEPQCSACFINSVQDTMEAILGLARTEGLLFKFGSGTGTNFSTLRSCRERLSNGGYASGPVSFMRGYDSFAGVIKSGGRTRRAAKMVVLNIDHPDIRDFIQCKAHEEKKAWALIDAGYDGSFGGEAYASVMFQNSNNSVRVTDDFMDAVIRDTEWSTRAVTDGEKLETMKARELMRDIADAAHLCGDPGMQFDTTVNDWHTCPNSGRINASNPCAEFMFIDDSACNLSSLNLMKFRKENGDFDVDAFRRAVKIMILAQEIIIDRATYPTPQITINSKRFRPLGLGYANLGALLMANGLPYDSAEGRALAGALTAIMTGESYKTSAEISSRMGPFSEYMKNREPYLQVMGKHRAQVDRIERLRSIRDLIKQARTIWDEAIKAGEQYGYRNAQTTLLAPTGTIGFMMDCDTTGVEPDIALVKYKKLSGGGLFKIVNQTVPEALKQLAYSEAQISEILQYIEKNDTIEGAPGLKEEHLPVFDCAFKPANGLRTIHYMGHLRMMSAVQPFLSGAISKTVNLPHNATIEEIMDLYIEAWRLGLKAVAIYRDGCKRTQPLNTKLDSNSAKTAKKNEAAVVEARTTFRRRLPDERVAITHKFSVGGHEGYVTVGQYEDGMPGEIFVKMSKQGSVVSGLMDSFAIAISLALQYGVPLTALIDKFTHSRFEPSGWTNNKEIPMAKSIVDYIFRWMAIKFLPKDLTAHYVTPTTLPEETDGMEEKEAPGSTIDDEVAQLIKDVEGNNTNTVGFDNQSDAPPCPTCGEIMVRNGSCYKCLNCGGTSGCS
ncbi:MAG: vitamin B12-dependent ribonucleotide reductase [Armatimonadota bacterium]